MANSINPQTAEAIVLMVKAGKSTKEIAAAMGIHVSHVNFVRRVFGVAAPRGIPANLTGRIPQLGGKMNTTTLRRLIRHFGPDAVKARVDELAGVEPPAAK